MEKQNERYSRQVMFGKIGELGQERIAAARVVIIGLGALGTVIANNLCRAGVGFLRIVDRDYAEISNLQRQVLLDEDDVAAGLSKAAAVRNHLVKINSQVAVEPFVVHVDASNIEELVKNASVVLDGSDNLEVRFLINDACHKLQIPWVYGGVLGASGNCLTVIPGGGPCFRCLIPHAPPSGSYPTCATAGVLNMASNIIASMESVEALKIITGSADINRRLFTLDVWNNTAEYLELPRDPACSTCGNCN